MASGIVSATEWIRRFRARTGFARHGSRQVDVPSLSLDQTSALMRGTGIHEGVLGPLRRAASKLNWIIMVRPVKVSAMFHCADFNKLPKPMAIKAKCHPATGMVMLENEADCKRALGDGRIEPGYAKMNGLALDPKPIAVPGEVKPLYYLVNNKGQRYYSDTICTTSSTAIPAVRSSLVQVARTSRIPVSTGAANLTS